MRPVPASLDGPGVQGRLGDAQRADPLDVAGHEVRAGRLERVQQPLVGMGRQDVIAVNEGQVGPGGPVEPAVAGVARAAVGHLDQGEPGVGRRPGRRKGRAGVRRAVIDHDDLKVGHGLRGNGRQAVIQQIRYVKERNNNANPRNCHKLSPRHVDE